MSPEICKAEQYTHFSDIWALGCIIYEMCAQEPPFNAKTHFELIQKIKLGRYPEIPKAYSAELRKVIASCLQIIPDNRPDTAQLLNLPAVKLMRKEQEVVRVANDMKDQKEKAKKMMEEAERRLAEVERMQKDLDSSLRREWELKARLEIDRQVKIMHDAELARLKDLFEVEVNKRVEQILAKHPSRLSTSPQLAPRSSTPTMPAAHESLFPTDATEAAVTVSSSSTGTDSSFASGTDISSLSLDDTPETTAQKPVPAKRSRRAPLHRAQTMFNNPVTAQVPPSPMDIQMADPSPAPASIAGLSLSPRKTAASRQNIFAAARDNAKKWAAEVPPSPTEEDWHRDFDDDDDLPVLPSPTRARSGSGGRSGSGDPLKNLTTAQRPVLKPAQRLASAPSLAPNSTKPRPVSSVSIVAASPSRMKSRTDLYSPSRKPTAASKTSEPSGFKSKKGNDHIRMQAIQNNGVRGRTLVELQQARGIPMQAMSEDETARKGRLNFGPSARSPAKARSANQPAAVWDPDTELDMPSPFIVRTKRMVK
jgi:serine/threonine protein kinase